MDGFVFWCFWQDGFSFLKGIMLETLFITVVFSIIDIILDFFTFKNWLSKVKSVRYFSYITITQ